MPAANALVAASAPREHSGEALGLLQTGAWVGVAVGPLLGGIIGDAVGFRESFWITGFLLALSGAAVMLWVEEDFHPVDKARRPKLMAGYRWLLQTPVMIQLYAVTFLHALGRMLIMPIAALFILQLMGTTVGVATVTGIMMGAMAVTSSVSGALIGRMGDRVGHDRVLLVSVLAAIGFYLPQPFVTAPWQLVMLQALTGLANGGMIPAVAALMNLQDSTGSQGAVYGLNASITAAGRSLAPMLGASMAIWLGLRSVFLAAACIYAAAAIVAVSIYRSGHRRGQPRPGR
jgi:DHA1 family multidrug resistance protein-like MFS transporter